MTGVGLAELVLPVENVKIPPPGPLGAAALRGKMRIADLWTGAGRIQESDLSKSDRNRDPDAQLQFPRSS